MSVLFLNTVVARSVATKQSSDLGMLMMSKGQHQALEKSNAITAAIDE